MPLKLRPTGLGSGIDKDRQDYTVYSGGWDIGRPLPAGPPPPTIKIEAMIPAAGDRSADVDGVRIAGLERISGRVEAGPSRGRLPTKDWRRSRSTKPAAARSICAGSGRLPFRVQ